MTHRYEGQWAIVVWPRDQAKWRGRKDAPPSHEIVTLTWHRKAYGTPWCGYLATLHLDGYRFFMHKTHVAKWLEKHEGRRTGKESAA